MQRLSFAECVLLALLNAASLSPCSHSDVWTEDFGFLRILDGFFVMTALLIVGPTSSAARWVALVMTAGVWQHLARHIIGLR